MTTHIEQSKGVAPSEYSAFVERILPDKPKPSILDRILCHFNMCYGYVEHAKDINGIWWCGLRCKHTGTLHDPIKSAIQDPK